MFDHLPDNELDDELFIRGLSTIGTREEKIAKIIEYHNYSGFKVF